MSPWEYRVFKFSTTGVIFRGGKIPDDWLAAELNKLGRQGWELVSIFTSTIGAGATNEVAAILKRPTQGEVDETPPLPTPAESEYQGPKHYTGRFNCPGCGAGRPYEGSVEIEGKRYCASCAARRG